MNATSDSIPAHTSFLFGSLLATSFGIAFDATSFAPTFELFAYVAKLVCLLLGVVLCFLAVRLQTERKLPAGYTVITLIIMPIVCGIIAYAILAPILPKPPAGYSVALGLGGTTGFILAVIFLYRESLRRLAMQDAE